MKKQIWRMSAATLLCGAMLTSCGRQAVKAEADRAATDSLENLEREARVKAAIDRFLIDSIGSLYAEAEVTVPAYEIVASEPSARGDTLRVWGDFWVYHCNVVDDTLQLAAGGSHPGLLHLLFLGDGCRVVRFDAVTDGSDFEPSARRIFKGRYDDFQAIISNHQRRDSLHLRAFANYVRRHGLGVTHLKEYGRPAVALPVGGE